MRSGTSPSWCLEAGSRLCRWCRGMISCRQAAQVDEEATAGVITWLSFVKRPSWVSDFPEANIRLRLSG